MQALKLDDDHENGADDHHEHHETKDDRHEAAHRTLLELEVGEEDLARRRIGIHLRTASVELIKITIVIEISSY